MNTSTLRRGLLLSAALALLSLAPTNFARAEVIDMGPFCGAECKGALTLKADPASIKGKVGVAIASLTFPYGAALKARTEEAAAKYFPGIELIVGDGQNDPSVQTMLVDNFIAQGVDVIIINAVEKDALAPAVKRAMDAGIMVIEVDRTVSTPVTTTIKANDYDIGFNAGKRMIEVLGGKGTVVELQGAAAASPTIDRHQGFMDAIKDSPDVKVIANNYADYDQAKGLHRRRERRDRSDRRRQDGLLDRDLSGRVPDGHHCRRHGNRRRAPSGVHQARRADRHQGKRGRVQGQELLRSQGCNGRIGNGNETVV